MLAILNNYMTLIRLFQQTTTLDTELKARLAGILANMEKFEFYFGLWLAYTVLRHTDNLAKSLQKSDLSAAEGLHMAEATIATLESLQNKVSTFVTTFDNFNL